MNAVRGLYFLLLLIIAAAILAMAWGINPIFPLIIVASAGMEIHRRARSARGDAGSPKLGNHRPERP